MQSIVRMLPVSLPRFMDAAAQGGGTPAGTGKAPDPGNASDRTQAVPAVRAADSGQQHSRFRHAKRFLDIFGICTDQDRWCYAVAMLCRGIWWRKHVIDGIMCCRQVITQGLFA